METLAFIAFNRWRNKLANGYFKTEVICKSKGGEPTGEVSGQGKIYRGPCPYREEEWADYICLRDLVDYRRPKTESGYPVLEQDQFETLRGRVERASRLVS
jgi:hypothetical protein